MKSLLSSVAGLGLAALLALPACQRPEQLPKPADLLPPEKVASVLVGVHVLEAQVEQSRLPVDSARALFQQQKALLMQRRQVSDSAFVHSFRYYGSHGKDLDAIYEAVNDSLAVRVEMLNHQ